MSGPILDMSVFEPVLNFIAFWGLTALAAMLGWKFADRVIRPLLGWPPLEKRKNESLNQSNVLHDQDTDDEKPKRQTYMTIGDDGELVEMDE